MSRKTLVMIAVICFLFLASGCQCKHENCSDATCTEPAVCLKCGISIGEPLEHEYTCSISTISTCTQEGEVKYVCERCGDTYTKPVPQLQHNGEETVLVKPSLTEMGKKSITCSMCGGVFDGSIPALGTTKDDPYPIKAASLYKDIKKDDSSKFQSKYLLVSGRVTYISDYGDLKGYYLYGSIGEGVVCWVEGKNLVANTGSNVEFLGRVESLAIDTIELTSCELQSEIEVTEEPGLSMGNAIPVKIEEISQNHVNRWIKFSGDVLGKVSIEDVGTWYYLQGDVACCSKETHSVGERVHFVGKVMGTGDLWDTVIDCVTVTDE